MKTRQESANIFHDEIGNLDGLIEKLNEVRAKTNGPVDVQLCGSSHFGYRINLQWERPMTEEESARDDELRRKAVEAEKEVRRATYEMLRKEFENE